ncbi:hypothetical protein IH992_10185 [Candidatus Poribacteria bacterium]|nr:hypothetical protein [Candidatus Poribacteria bacterium]
MHYSEAITSLIEHAVHEQRSPEQLNHDLRDHITQGVVAGDEEMVGGIYHEVAVRLHENHNEDPSRLQSAKLHYQAARWHLSPEHPAYAQTLMSEGRVCNILGDLETARAENYNRGVNLFREAQGHFAAGSTERGEALVCEGAARCRCGRISIEPQKNFLEAIALFQEARRHFSPNSTDAAGSFYREGDAHRFLAEWNIHPVENLN